MHMIYETFLSVFIGIQRHEIGRRIDKELFDTVYSIYVNCIFFEISIAYSYLTKIFT